MKLLRSFRAAATALTFGVATAVYEVGPGVLRLVSRHLPPERRGS
jgi:hypothetical protein